MFIGVPKEIKNHEYRVAISPRGVRELTSHNHKVFIQKNAGAAIGISDADYQKSGANILETAEEIFDKADMIVKVKELQQNEYKLLKKDQILFCYLHLAAEPELTRALIDSGANCIAYETVTDKNNTLPLLTPMSEIAGRIAIQAAASCLQINNGGKGILIGGAPGVAPAKIVILGGGFVGMNSASIASGMGGDVTILERNVDRIRELENIFQNKVRVVFSTEQTIEDYVVNADILIGAVLIPGAAAPKLVSKDLVAKMQKGSVIVDVAVDQGGCIETIKPTTHQNPTYEQFGVIHYGVTNMPSITGYTSTNALENATLPYITQLANLGINNALKFESFRNGLNIYKNQLTNKAVAEALNLKYTPLEKIIID